MTTDGNAQMDVDYSRYGGMLLAYLREAKMDDLGMVDGVPVMEINRDIGQAGGVDGLPERSRRYFTSEFQAEVKDWAVKRGVPEDQIPTVKPPTGAAPEPPAVVPNEPAQSAPEEPTNG